MDKSVRIEMSKIPEVTLGFWIIKISATTLERGRRQRSDVEAGAGLPRWLSNFRRRLLVVLGAQIKAKRFHPFLYWAVITATTLAGTTLADFFDRSLGIGEAAKRSGREAHNSAELLVLHLDDRGRGISVG
jgi:uncharacterized membrane-anchored protein